MKPADLINQLIRAIKWHRRPLAAVAAGCCLLSLCVFIAEPKHPQTAVVVAARPLKPGQKLTAVDLNVVDYPEQLVPAGAFSEVNQVVGKNLTAGVTEGQPLTSASVLTRDFIAEDGHSLVPVRVQDYEIVQLVNVGDRISIYSTAITGFPEQLASSVVVAGLPESSDDSILGALIVVSVDETTAEKLAPFSGSGLSIAFG